MPSSLDDRYRICVREKNRDLRNSLKGIIDPPEIPEIATAPLEKGYRSRAKFKIFRQGERLEIMATDPLKGSREAEKTLWILPPWGRNVVRVVADLLRSNSRSVSVDGFELQLAHGRRHTHLTFSVPRRTAVFPEFLAEGLLRTIPSLRGIAVPSQGLVWREEFLKHRLLGRDLVSHHRAFFQSHLHLTPFLVEEVRNVCSRSGSERCFDLYCGSGLFSFLAAEQMKEVFGTDDDPWAIQGARINAKNMNRSPECFFCLPAERFVLEDKIGKGDCLIIDPPRQGCPTAVIKSVAGAKPEKICLVSCSLETHIRDLKQWLFYGYRAKTFKALDAFPFTRFLETVTELERI
jgi:tRNA/tmRNA/rRNA uracil-C5-methylase (TrmA/RlmC/RlmD family)